VAHLAYRPTPTGIELLKGNQTLTITHDESRSLIAGWFGPYSAATLRGGDPAPTDFTRNAHPTFSVVE